MGLIALDRLDAYYAKFARVYHVAFATTTLVVLALDPARLLAAFFVASAWAAYASHGPATPLVVLGAEWGRPEKTAALAVVTLVVVSVSGLVFSLLWVTAATALAIACHYWLPPPN